MPKQENQRCVVCHSVRQCSQVKLTATSRIVFVCNDLAQCITMWLEQELGTEYSRLAVWLAERATHEDVKTGPCLECGDMVFRTEDRFTFSGGRANLHMPCFIKRLNANVIGSLTDAHTERQDNIQRG